PQDGQGGDERADDQTDDRPGQGAEARLRIGGARHRPPGGDEDSGRCQQAEPGHGPAPPHRRRLDGRIERRERQRILQPVELAPLVAEAGGHDQNRPEPEEDETAETTGDDVGQLVADEAGARHGQRRDQEHDAGQSDQAIAEDPVPAGGKPAGHDRPLRHNVDAASRTAPAAARTAMSTRPGFFRSGRASTAGAAATSSGADGVAGAAASPGRAGTPPASEAAGSGEPAPSAEDSASGDLPVARPASGSAGVSSAAEDTAGGPADAVPDGVGPGAASGAGVDSPTSGTGGSPGPAAPKVMNDVDPP